VIPAYPKRYTAVHYPKTKKELVAMKELATLEGRVFTSRLGEPLPDDDAIRLALRLDGEVWSR
jgi:hypothetical protein